MDYLQYSLGGALAQFVYGVLNLVINGLPSIQYLQIWDLTIELWYVLNLVINGLPSILNACRKNNITLYRFKPCYKWITFNTLKSESGRVHFSDVVLNLVINGLPSIHICRKTL